VVRLYDVLDNRAGLPLEELGVEPSATGQRLTRSSTCPVALPARCPHMTLTRSDHRSGAAMAGAMNSVAGGGTFFSFPPCSRSACAGRRHASNAVALWPGVSGAYATGANRAFPGRFAAYGRRVVGGVAAEFCCYRRATNVFDLDSWLSCRHVMFAGSGRIAALLAACAAGRSGPSHASGAGCCSSSASRLRRLLRPGMCIVMIAALAIQGHRDIPRHQALKIGGRPSSTASPSSRSSRGAVCWPHTSSS